MSLETHIFFFYALFKFDVRTGGHQIIGSQISDVALFRALQTQICEICIQCRLLHEKLKPHRKNGQIMANNKHFTVENVCPPYPPTKRTYGTGEVKYFNQKVYCLIELELTLDI